jgi:hypothetical protein
MPSAKERRRPSDARADLLSEYFDLLLMRPGNNCSLDDLRQQQENALLRYSAYQDLGSSDLDHIAFHARELLKFLKHDAVHSCKTDSARGRFEWGARLFHLIARLGEDPILADAMAVGIAAIGERDRGFDEPMLRAIPTITASRTISIESR